MYERTSDALIHSTVRIECRDADENTSTGTCFYVAFDIEPGQPGLALITNAQVVSGAISATFVISTATGNDSPDYGRHKYVTVPDIQSFICQHPDGETDLVAIVVPPIFRTLNEQGYSPFIRTITREITISSAHMRSIGNVENVLMFGYPNGLWDKINNLPLVRHGLTATPLSIDWEGKPQFVIDCACYPGSSGSPVFLHNNGLIPTGEEGNVNLGERILFLGVLYAGPQITVGGDMKVVDIPTSKTLLPQVNMMMNLGYCIKASKVFELLDHLVKQA